MQGIDTPNGEINVDLTAEPAVTDPATRPSPDVLDLQQRQRLEAHLKIKGQETAAWVTQWIIYAFVGTLGVLFLGGLLAGGVGIALDIWACAGDEVNELEYTMAVLQGYRDLVETTGRIAATLFGPLLAFILGHHFRAGQEARGGK